MSVCTHAPYEAFSGGDLCGIAGQADLAAVRLSANPLGFNVDGGTRFRANSPHIGTAHPNHLCTHTLQEACCEE